MGRKKKNLPPDALETIEKLASRGVRETDIARALGVSWGVYWRIKNENEAVKKTLEQARMIEHDALFGQLYEKAMKGDSTAAMFLLKTRHGYREGADVVAANQVNVKITLPGSMKPDEYKKMMEVKTDGHSTK